MNYVVKAIQKLLTIADKDTSTDEERRHHGFLIYMGLLMSSGGLLWGSICVYHGIYIAAAVPYSYIMITVLNFTYLYYSKNFTFAKDLQIIISLLLPFFFQFFLGGFVTSGGNVLWSVIAVFGSFTLRDKKMSIIWLLLFILLMIFSGLVDSYAKPYDVGLENSETIFFFLLNFVFVITIIFSLYYYFVSSEEVIRGKLEDSLETLRVTQDQLIESEKMASLGSLVSGIAHELNTPLGVGLTGVSQMNHELKKLISNYEKDTLTEEALKDYFTVSQKLIDTINDRLNNAATLVKSFKSISVDQHFEDKREFNLYQYTNNIVISLQNQLKTKQVNLINTIPDNIILDTYPGVISQVFSNLILNSLVHAFDDSENNEINISVDLGDALVIIYEDNGKGISKAVEKKIFDPFFTTKRGQGGSGLGLHIIYNLVTQRLLGTLEPFSVSPHGLGFKISLDTSLIKGS